MASWRRGFRPPRRRSPLGMVFDVPSAGMPPAIRSPSIQRAAAAMLTRWIAVVVVSLGFAFAVLPTAARADTIVVKSAELRVDEDLYVLNAEFELAFNPTLEEAIQKGVPLYFVFEFELMRPRWFWVD